MSELPTTAVISQHYLWNPEPTGSSDEVQIIDYPIPGVVPDLFDLTKALSVARLLAEDFHSNDRANGVAYSLMVASEAVLAKQWDTPEEDDAWRHL